MNPVLRDLVARNGGLITRAQAAEVVAVHSIERACRDGGLVRILPTVYRAAEIPDGPRLRWRAALAYADDRGALSHTTALAVWGLREPAPHDPVHLTVARGIGLRSRPDLVVHRADGFGTRQTRTRDGMRVTRLERSLVQAWPLLPAGDRRAPAIRAVSDRLTTAERIAAELARAPRMAGRGELTRVLDLLQAGCRSPLEIWGHQHVFTGAGMPPFRRQVPVRLGGRTVYLDVFAEPELVNFELDGAASHGDPAQREVDLHRDALLAAQGILVVRFSRIRLVRDADTVRREALAILAVRSKA